MNIEILKMELCLQVIQHELDSRTGLCAAGQEEACFGRMLSCVDPGKLDSFMSAMDNSLNRIGQSTQNIGSTFQKISDTWTSTKYLDALWGVSPGDDGLRITWGGVARSSICSHDGLKDGVSVATISSPLSSTLLRSRCLCLVQLSLQALIFSIAPCTAECQHACRDYACGYACCLVQLLHSLVFGEGFKKDWCRERNILCHANIYK